MTGAAPVPTVSVLMPVYNSEAYVAEAVESILAQTFADFEFLIVDDGSTDGTLRLLEGYAARDPRVRVISRANTGCPRAFNEALRLARGEFIARMDGDDVSLPCRLEKTVRFLRENPRVLVVSGAVDLIDEAARLLLRSRNPLADREIQEGALGGRCLIVNSAALMRREPVLAAGGCDVGLFPSEDLDLFLRLGEVGELANLPDVLGKYRLHCRSGCATAGDRQKEAAREACERAWKRRGIEGRFECTEARRPGTDRRSFHRFTLTYGWWAFQSAQRATALRYGWRAVRVMPWNPEGWRLLACAAVKPMPAGTAAS